MNYHISKTIKADFEKSITAIRAALDKEGFGVLTVADVTMALKKQLGINFRKYTILGACNAPYSKKAIEAERWIGTMLPCNIVVQETDDNKIEISAVNPVASLQAVDNPEVQAIAAEIKEKLYRVMDSI